MGGNSGANFQSEVGCKTDFVRGRHARAPGRTPLGEAGESCHTIGEWWWIWIAVPDAKPASWRVIQKITFPRSAKPKPHVDEPCTGFASNAIGKENSRTSK